MASSEPTQVTGLGLTIPPGTRLNGVFEIERQIGAGGMGMVYAAHNVETGDKVAIKIVRTEMAGNEQVLALFRKEAAVLHRLLHDAIVRYYLFTSDPGIGRPYLATEFVDGTSLSDMGAIGRDEVLALAERLAGGLQAAHAMAVFHRDISPDNVILPERDVRKAKIIDFGIARSATLGGGTVIGDSIAGKFDYMSPEQLGLYGGQVDARSDIYSLGIVLAEAVLGRSLKMGGSQLEVVEKRRKVPDLSAIEPKLRALLSAMLQPRPEDRIATMAAVAEGARKLRMGAGAAPGGRPLGKVAAGVAALLVAGGAAAWLLIPQGGPSAPPAAPPTLVRQAGDGAPALVATAPAAPEAEAAPEPADAAPGGGDAPEAGSVAVGPGDAGTAPAVAEAEAGEAADTGAGAGEVGAGERAGEAAAPEEALAGRAGRADAQAGETAAVDDTAAADGALSAGGADAAASADTATTQAEAGAATPPGDGAPDAAVAKARDPAAGGEVAPGEAEATAEAALDAASDSASVPETAGEERLDAAGAAEGSQDDGVEAAAVPPDVADAADDAGAAEAAGTGAGTAAQPGAEVSVADAGSQVTGEDPGSGEAGGSARETAGGQAADAAGVAEDGGEVEAAAGDGPASAEEGPAVPPDAVADAVARLEPGAGAAGAQPPSADAAASEAAPVAEGAQAPQGAVEVARLTPGAGGAGEADLAGRIDRFLRAAALGPCTFVQLAGTGPQRADIVAYGNSVPPFQRLDDSFRDTFDFSADINLRPVSDGQCPAIDLAQALDAPGHDRLQLRVNRDTVAPGGLLSGTVSGIGQRKLHLYLVAGDGHLYGLADLIERNGDAATFRASMASGDDGPAQHLLIAVAAKSLPNLPAGADGNTAGALSTLRAYLADDPDAEAALGYFKYGG